MAKHNLGMVTAYAYAVAGGYTGTEAEFEALLGNIATDLEEIENLTVTATTLPEGSSATASYSDGVLTLGIPKGDTGATGAGATATAGTTTTGEPGTDASVVNSGTTKDAVFDFTIPRGDTGTGIESITLTSTVGAVHTYTITFTDGDTTTFDVTDGEVTTAALTAILADYAKTDGAYESMTVGNAEQLISSVYVTDEEPYQFRTSGGSADIGDREFDTLVGGSVAWNQLVANSNRDYTNAVTDTKTYVIFTVQEFNGSTFVANVVNVGIQTTGQFGCIYKLASAGTRTYIKHNGSVRDLSFANIDNSVFPANHVYSVLGNFKGVDPTTVNGVVLNDLMLVDLTQLFGSTIADYIYTLEQGQAGAGVAFFRKYFPKPYYPYDAGTIKSVEGVSAHKMVGFNAWDEEWELGRIGWNGQNYNENTYIRCKNYIRCIGGATYYCTTSVGIQLFYYDIDKNLIKYEDSSVKDTIFTPPQNAFYMRFYVYNTSYGTTYKNDICINLSWDGERNGEYEQYVEHSYPLDDSLTLRGIPKIANGKLYYDGDTYESDGTVTRKYGIVDLGTLTWGTNTNSRFSPTDLVGVKPSANNNEIASAIIIGYTPSSSNAYINSDKTFYISTDGKLNIRDTSYANASAFTSAMSGVYLVYELATPTTETADTFVNPQIVDDFGTEEYVTTSIVPVGHSTKYTNNLKAKLEMSPDSPSGDGLYLVQQSSGQNAYVQYISPVPSNPSTDGTYVLKATVSGGTATLTWVAE